MKRSEAVSILILLALLSAAMVPASAASLVANLVANGGFEDETLGTVSMWTMDASTRTDAAVRFFVTEQARHSGRRSLAIANLQPNDSQAVQWIVVKPGTLYRLTAWIMVRGTTTGEAGASVSVLGGAHAAGNFSSTGGRWRHVQLYGRTRADQSALAVIARLGFGGSPSSGIALFDDVALEEAAALPEGTPAIDFGANEAAGPVLVTGEGKGAAGVYPATAAATPWSLPWGVVLALAALAAATTIFNGAVLLRTHRRPTREPHPN